jgi:hypothetical protein
MDAGDPLLSRFGCLLVAYHDTGDLWHLVEPTIYRHIPLRNVVWKLPTGTASTTIPQLNFTFMRENHPDLSFPPLAANWYRSPYLYMYLLRCDNVDAYKASCKAELGAWIDEVSKRQHEWLVVYVPVLAPGSSLKKPLKVLDKIKSDFCGRKNAERCVLIDPVGQGSVARSMKDSKEVQDRQRHGQRQWATLMYTIEKCATASLSARVKAYEQEIRKRYEQKALPGWNYCTYFCLREAMAFVYAQVTAVDGVVMRLAVGIPA